MDKYVTVKELSIRSQRTVGRIHQLIKEGKLPAVWCGSVRLIREDTARAFCERCAELDGRSQLSLTGFALPSREERSDTEAA